QLERSRIGPLEVVEEQGDGVFRRREGAQELLHQEAEAVLGLGRPEDRRLRLSADDELELRDQIEQESPAPAGGLPELVLPGRERARRFGQDLADEVAERVRHRREGDVAADVIELSPDEVAALLSDGLVDLLDERRLADAGVAGDQAELGRAPARPLEA